MVADVLIAGVLIWIEWLIFGVKVKGFEGHGRIQRKRGMYVVGRQELKGVFEEGWDMRCR